MVRRLPIGAEVQPDGAIHFRVWAPRSSTVQVELHEPDTTHPYDLDSEGNGYFSGLIGGMPTMPRYRLRLINGSFPDPASRFQPDGPHGDSMVWDPSIFLWSDAAWVGITAERPVIYELHIGTFTQEGTWTAATARLDQLARLGVDVIEVMPVADFSGRFGWGYDGVNSFAPCRNYGNPDEMRAFIDRAHTLHLGVLLDVVYNHWGPDGNYLSEFSKDYLSEKTASEWGPAVNYDGRNSQAVRDYVVANATYWIDEFHLDGLRFDATQQIFDRSATHILTEISAAVKAVAPHKKLYLVAESEPQDSVCLRSEASGGFGFQAVWNDDFHHSIMVALTGRAEAYYSDFRGTAQELLSTLRHGPLFQGQRSRWQKKNRGTPAGPTLARQFVLFLQNHDQVANTLRGERIHSLSNPAAIRAATGLLLIAPNPVLLFQGQEFGSTARFQYFADHKGDLGRQIAIGRRAFLRQFPGIVYAEESIPEPTDESAFAVSKLDHAEIIDHAEIYRLHGDLLTFRRFDSVISSPKETHGAVLAPDSLAIRLTGTDGGQRLLLLNLGRDLSFEPAPEPLMAPVAGHAWIVKWSSEEARYGGQGCLARQTETGWLIPGNSATLFTSYELP